jgi:SOS-response transcriptional repressor LexA
MNQVSTEDLSKRQTQVYDSIVAHVQEYGFAPTVRELCKLTGLTSTSSIVGHLEKKGYIKRYPTHPRAITILQ